MENKLQTLWLERILANQNLGIEDLFRYSKIKLKKSRNKKKFLKHYGRYVPKNIYETYWGCVMAHPLVSSFKHVNEFPDLKPINSEGLPKVELCYLDYKYENK